MLRATFPNSYRHPITGEPYGVHNSIMTWLGNLGLTDHAGTPLQPSNNDFFMKYGPPGAAQNPEISLVSNSGDHEYDQAALYLAQQAIQNGRTYFPNVGPSVPPELAKQAADALRQKMEGRTAALQQNIMAFLDELQAEVGGPFRGEDALIVQLKLEFGMDSATAEQTVEQYQQEFLGRHMTTLDMEDQFPMGWEFQSHWVEAGVPGGDFRPGDRVWLPNMKLNGTVLGPAYQEMGMTIYRIELDNKANVGRPGGGNVVFLSENALYKADPEYDPFFSMERMLPSVEESANEWPDTLPWGEGGNDYYRSAHWVEADVRDPVTEPIWMADDADITALNQHNLCERCGRPDCIHMQPPPNPQGMEINPKLRYDSSPMDAHGA